MSANKPSIPKGSRDFGPAEMAKRDYIFSTIKSVYRRYGFQPLETPAMENLSVLLGKYGEEGDRLIFRVLNSGDFLQGTTDADFGAGAGSLVKKIAEKGLRYDLTVPFARYVAMQRTALAYPFKRYQIQPVWRGDRPQKGRYREFYQCDADVVGTASLLCEGEITAMLAEVFQGLGIDNYTIKINHRQVLAGIAEAAGAPGQEAALCVAIDKLDKIGQEKVDQELAERGFTAESIGKLGPLLALKGSNAEKTQVLAQMLEGSATGLKGLAELEQIFRLAEQLGVPGGRLSFDPSLARGLGYYTGAIFEVKVNNVAIGSVSGGGRYDNLTGVFGFENMPGVGISFGVDRLYDVMEELGLFPESSLQGTQVLFLQFGEAELDYCLPLLQSCRQEGLSAEIYPDADKIKKQLTYANNKFIPFVVLAGEDEIKAGVVTLKDMATGQQEQIEKNRLAAELAAKFAG